MTRKASVVHLKVHHVDEEGGGEDEHLGGEVDVLLVGEISSDLYGLSGCDILNLTFCRLDFHQLLIKIS